MSDNEIGKLLPGGTPFWTGTTTNRKKMVQGMMAIYMGDLEPGTVVARPTWGPHQGQWMPIEERGLELRTPLKTMDYLDVHRWTVGGVKVLHIDWTQNAEQHEAEHLFIIYGDNVLLRAEQRAFTSPQALAEACSAQGGYTDQAFLDLLEGARS